MSNEGPRKIQSKIEEEWRKEGFQSFNDFSLEIGNATKSRPDTDILRTFVERLFTSGELNEETEVRHNGPRKFYSTLARKRALELMLIDRESRSRGMQDDKRNRAMREYLSRAFPSE